MSVTVAPATLLDLAELSGSRTRTQWGVSRALFATGQFFAFRAGDELLALAGFNRVGDTGGAEMFFNPAPAARRHMPGILAAGRLTIAAAPYRAIVTVCRSDAGKLFARRLGFTFQAHCELGEVWGHGPIDRRGVEKSEQGAADAAGREPGGAAAIAGAAGSRTG